MFAVFESAIRYVVDDRGIDRLDGDVVGDDIIVFPLAGITDLDRHHGFGQRTVFDGEFDLFHRPVVGNKGRGVSIDLPLSPKHDVLTSGSIDLGHDVFACLVRRPTDELIARLGRLAKNDVVVLDRVTARIGSRVDRAVHILIFDIICVDGPCGGQYDVLRDAPFARSDAYAVGHGNAVRCLPPDERITDAGRDLERELFAERHLRLVNGASSGDVKRDPIAVCAPAGSQGHVARHPVRFEIPRFAVRAPARESITVTARVFERRQCVFLDLLGHVGDPAAEAVRHRIDLAPSYHGFVLVAVGTRTGYRLNVKDVVPHFEFDRRRRDHFLSRNVGRNFVLCIGTDRQLLPERERSLRVGQLDRQSLAVHGHLAAVDDRTTRGVARRHPFGIQRDVFGHGVRSEIPYRRKVRLPIPAHKRIARALGRDRLDRKRTVRHALRFHLTVSHRVKDHLVIALGHVFVDPLGINGHVACQLDRQQRLGGKRTRPYIFVPIPTVKDVSVLGRIVRQRYGFLAARVYGVIDLTVNDKVKLELRLTRGEADQQRRCRDDKNDRRQKFFIHFAPPLNGKIFIE